MIISAETPRPIGPPLQAPVEPGPREPIEKPDDRHKPPPGITDIVDVEKPRRGLGRVLAQLTKVAKAIEKGEEVPLRKVRKALRLTRKVAEHVKDDPKIPPKRKEKLLARLEDLRNVFVNYLREHMPPKPVPEPIPLEAEAVQLPEGGIVV